MLQDDLEYGDQAVSSIDLELADPGGGAAAWPRKCASLGPRRPQGRRLARPQCPLRGRPAGRAGDDVHHPYPDRGGGGDERGGEFHHAGPRQARQHRHPAHHGRVARAPSCAPSSCRLPPSGWSAPPSAPRSASWSAPTLPSIGARCRDDGCGGQRFGRGRFITSMPVRVQAVEVGPSSSWRSCCRWRRRPIRPGAARRVEPVEGLRHE